MLNEFLMYSSKSLVLLIVYLFVCQMCNPAVQDATSFEIADVSIALITLLVSQSVTLDEQLR